MLKTKNLDSRFTTYLLKTAIWNSAVCLEIKLSSSAFDMILVAVGGSSGEIFIVIGPHLSDLGRAKIELKSPFSPFIQISSFF